MTVLSVEGTDKQAFIYSDETLSSWLKKGWAVMLVRISGT